MKTTVQSVQPVIDRQTGQQRTWTSKDGKTSYYFDYVLANGQRGEVGHQQPQPRFPVGTEVEATDATNPQYPQYPKLKLEKPAGFQGGGRKSDPEYQATLKASGMVQAAIAGGAKNDAEIDALVILGFGAAKRWKERIMERQAQQQPQPAPQPYPQPVAQPPVTHQPAAQYGAPQGHMVGQMPQGQQATTAPPWANNPGASFNPAQAIAGQPAHIPDGPGESLPF